MQDNHTHERALALLEKLMALRPTFSHHKSVLESVDHAIGNVFKTENHDEIGNYVPKLEKLVSFVQEMNKLGVSTTGIGLPLPDVHVSEANPQYQEVNAKYEKLRDVRNHLTVLGIPTIDVEIAMADILMKHGAALAVQVLEDPTIMKKRSPFTGVKTQPLTHLPGQSIGLDATTPLNKTEAASGMKRSASVDDDGDINPEVVSEGEADGAKRRKTSLWASLGALSRRGKECTEAWRVPVNEVATDGLRLVSKESDGSLLLSFDTRTQSIVVVFKGQCLSGKYPSLELIPSDIYAVTRHSPQTKKEFRARFSTRDYQGKIRLFDVIFFGLKDCETFLDKILLRCYHEVYSYIETSYAMEKLFASGLWVEKKLQISGKVVAKRRTKEIVELE